MRHCNSCPLFNPRNNEACGACYQHGKDVKLELDTFEDCKNLEKAIEDHQLHIPSECLVVGVSSLNEKKPFQPAIIWPSRCKDDIDGTLQIIEGIKDVMQTKYGHPDTSQRNLY